MELSNGRGPQPEIKPYSESKGGVWGMMLCSGAFTFKIATAVYNKTLKQFQHVMWLNPKCKNYTGRASVFEVGNEDSCKGERSCNEDDNKWTKS
jgi:hypothetical protein